jgi:AcrR family transcriptional regulator
MTKRPAIDPEKAARIITVACHEFAASGYRDTKTEVIAAEAKVSKGLLFHYFKSKANLYLETVQQTFDKITTVADWHVWQDAPNLQEMVARALRYKIALQLQYPDEFALSMQAYSDSDDLPAALKPQVQAIWADLLTDSVPMLINPILERLPLRPGVDPKMVTRLMLGFVNLISEESKAMIQANPHIKIEAFDDIVAETKTYMDILEHGFLDPNATH